MVLEERVAVVVRDHIRSVDEVEDGLDTLADDGWITTEELSFYRDLCDRCRRKASR
jgi:hypothetical protein